MSSSLNPQNPYRSFIVRASAGSGKTYQLSRRFLCLVAQGAEPTSILTITFTQKAAAEMRERILQEAQNLIHLAENATEFNALMRDFYTEAQQQNPLIKIPPPLSAIQVGKKILAATQSLKISTIDSLFIDWVRKFPWEASGDSPLPAGFRVLDPLETIEINHQAIDRNATDFFHKNPWLLREFGMPPRQFTLRAVEIQRLATYVWLLTQIAENQGRTSQVFLPHVLPEAPFIPSTTQELIQHLTIPLLAICQEMPDDLQESMREAIAAHDLEALRELKILKASGEISGTRIKKAKAERLRAEIDQINALARLYINTKNIKALNKIGAAMMEYYRDFEQERATIKTTMGGIEFDDSSKGCYRLFTRDEAAGARFLIHRGVQHVMIDEFQDTNRLQWDIFRTMADEMLAGAGVHDEQPHASTFFIVGDEKQSIYGFREADASILSEAATTMTTNGTASDVVLSRSYRTSQNILSFVNEVFSPMIADFPLHETAQKPDQTPVVPNYSRIVIADYFKESETSSLLPLPLSPLEQEANFVAAWLREALYGAAPLAVVDKNAGGFRPLRPDDCVILYHSSTHAAVFEKALRAQGIEARKEEKKGFFHRPEIIDLLALLRFLAYPDDILSLSIVLKSPLFHLSDTRLLKLLRHKPKDPQTLRSQRILAHLKVQRPQQVAALYEAQAACGQLSLQSIIFKLLSVTDCWGAYRLAMPGSEGELAIANIMKFFDFVLKCEQQFGWLPSQVLVGFERLQQQDIGNAAASANAVSLMTIHKSKGLEYPLVVLVDTGVDWHKKDAYWIKAHQPDVGFGVTYVGVKQQAPDGDKNFDRLHAQIEQEKRDEYHRLLYVALTRTKHHLLITGREPGRGNHDQNYLAILLDTAQKCHFQTTEFQGHTIWQRDHLPVVNLWQTPKGREKFWPAFTQNLSNLDTDVPKHRSELFTLAPHRVLHQGESSENLQGSLSPRLAAAFGTFVHRGLETWVKREQFDAEKVWNEILGLEATSPEGTQLLSKAQDHLHTTLRHPQWLQLFEGAINQEAELAFVHRDGDFLVRGTIDLFIQRSEFNLEVIDYKTTGWQTGESYHQPFDLHFIREKGYDQQLALYQRAVQALYPEAKQTRCGIYFTSQNQTIWLDSKPSSPTPRSS